MAIGWLTLVIWLPATSLCLVERAGWLSAKDCCEESPAQSTPAKSGGTSACCALDSSSYKAHENESLCCSAFQAVAADIEPRDSGLPGEALRSVNAQSLPGLSNNWQFAFRAAAPARAPSLLS